MIEKYTEHFNWKITREFVTLDVEVTRFEVCLTVYWRNCILFYVVLICLLGVEVWDAMWSVRDINYYAGCNISQYTKEGRLAYRKNAKQGFHSFVNGK